jgi:preprotein translocase subunit YajC
MNETFIETSADYNNVAEAVTQPRSATLWDYAFPLIMMFAVLYFFIILPQQKRAKETKSMLDSLKQHDKVVTASGIVGVIVNINDEKGFVVLRVDETSNTRMTFLKSAISSVIPSETTNKE